MAAGLAASAGIVDAMGASDAVRPYALTYLRISLLGAPFMLVALAATGYVRGLQDTRTPLVIALASNVVNLAVEVVLVYGFDLGIAGSAWGTVVAQAGAAGAFVVVVSRTVRREHAAVRPQVSHLRAAAVVGGQITVRTGALLVAFVTATAVAARLGDAEVAAHQIAWQVWYFLALALDAIAIAGQAIVGRYLGAGDALGARAVSRRMIEWGVLVGIAAAVLVVVAQPLLGRAFTADPAVRDLLGPVLWSVALMQPVAGMVFVLDGILLGAGDARYLAGAMVAATAMFLPAALAVLALDGTLLLLWGAIWVLMLARLAGMAARYRGEGWLVLGAIRA
jgi:putative MATE family efflux protein